MGAGARVPSPRTEARELRALSWSAVDTMPGLSAKRVRPKPAERTSLRGADADVAQLVEHFTRNEGVRGSSPRVGFTIIQHILAFLLGLFGSGKA